MAAGVVLDTSFLITLLDHSRAHYKTADRYWEYFAEQRFPVYLSTIVVSEFCIRQEVPPEILKNCVPLPFNWDDAIKAAKLNFSKTAREGESRDALKDDVKIIAQAIVKDAAWIITDDELLYKYAHRLATADNVALRPIKLKDGFDLAFFRPPVHPASSIPTTGQPSLFDSDPAPDEDLP